MGIRDLWFPGRGGRESNPQSATTDTLAGVLEKYDLVEVVPNDGDPFVIVAEREPAPLSTVALRDASSVGADTREIGTSSPSPFTSFARQEYNRDLIGLKGLQQYDRMRKSDGTVRGTLRLVKTPVLSARWFMEPASTSVRDRNKANFVWKCLTEYMSISFTQVLTESLLMADFGYYMFEKVWTERMVEGKRRIVWQKLAPRHPMDVKEWVYDGNGGPAAVKMYPATMSLQEDIYIPIDKLLVFSFDREGGNIEGISVLRSAYKHWYYKEQLYKIDAIQKERHGIGIPVIKLPPGFSRDDKTAANELGRNLRTNERAHVVLPPNWDLIFAKMEGHMVDAMKSIEHHDGRIRENVLGGFLGDKSPTKEEDQTMFLKASRFIADIVCDDFNNYAIPQLIDLNFERGEGYPKLRARRIGETEDQRTLSFTIRNMVGAKVITPDKKLEEHVRRELDLPEMDEETSRVEEVDNANKQNGAQAGLPRQGAKPPVGPPSGNAGVDKSGGK